MLSFNFLCLDESNIPVAVLLSFMDKMPDFAFLL